MNRHQRRANRKIVIEYVVRGGREIPIWSAELDDLCDEDGNLILQGSGEEALVIHEWRDTIRVVPS